MVTIAKGSVVYLLVQRYGERVVIAGILATRDMMEVSLSRSFEVGVPGIRAALEMAAVKQWDVFNPPAKPPLLNPTARVFQTEQVIEIAHWPSTQEAFLLPPK